MVLDVTCFQDYSMHFDSSMEIKLHNGSSSTETKHNALSPPNSEKAHKLILQEESKCQVLHHIEENNEA